MHDADRFRLHGSYNTPRFRYGQVVVCEVRGEVTICGLTDAPIPWPVGIKKSSRSLVVYGALAKAVRTEPNQAVAHWWGKSVFWSAFPRLDVSIAPQRSEVRRGHGTPPPGLPARILRRRGSARRSLIPPENPEVPHQ
jgi:hypothetical protein